MVNYTYSELRDWTSEMTDNLGWILSNKEDKHGYGIDAYTKSLRNLKTHLFKKVQNAQDPCMKQDLFILLEKVLILEQRTQAVKDYFMQLERISKSKKGMVSPMGVGELFKTPKEYKQALRSPKPVKVMKERGWGDYFRGKNKPGPKNRARGFLDWWVDPNAEFGSN